MMVQATSELIKAIDTKNIVDIAEAYSIQGASIDLSLGETAKIQKCVGTINLADKPDLENIFEVVELAKGYELKPNCYMYADTIEYIKIPSDLCAIVLPRSSFARMGLILPMSMYANPGYEGHLPIVIYNASPNSIIIPPYYRIAQMLLLKLDGIAKPYGEQIDAKYFKETDIPVPSFDDCDIDKILEKFNAKK